ncbi:DMT family transporter [Kineococcus gynurae]|uniref:DMT family transporter n=1 Tax=Kineococcus gynurae TaxID=452979 RepID=A0ABV5LSD6_9ACTN
MIPVLLASLLWGTTGTAATLLPSNVTPLAVGAATMALGGIVLALSAPRRVAVVLRGGRGTWRELVPGAVLVGVYPLAFYSSMSLAGVAIGNVVSLGTAPVFAVVLELLRETPSRRRPPSARWMRAAGASVAGVAILALFGHGPAPGGPGTEPPNVPLGIACGAVAGLAYAGYTGTAGRLLADGFPSRGAVGAQFGLGALLLWPVLILTGGPLLGDAPAAGSASELALALGNPAPWQVVTYLALGPMVIAYLLFGHGLRSVTSSQATTLTLVEPFAATLLAVLVLGERLTATGWLGLGMVLCGVIAVARQSSRPDRAGTAREGVVLTRRTAGAPASVDR